MFFRYVWKHFFLFTFVCKTFQSGLENILNMVKKNKKENAKFQKSSSNKVVF